MVHADHRKIALWNYQLVQMSGSIKVNDSALNGHGCRLRPVIDGKLFENAPHVVLNRELRNAKRFADLLVRESLDHQP